MFEFQRIYKVTLGETGFIFWQVHRWWCLKERNLNWLWTKLSRLANVMSSTWHCIYIIKIASRRLIFGNSQRNNTWHMRQKIKELKTELRFKIVNSSCFSIHEINIHTAYLPKSIHNLHRPESYILKYLNKTKYYISVHIKSVYK